MVNWVKKLFSLVRFGRIAFGKYKWRILFLTILGFVSGLVEGIGVNALIPLFSFAFEGGQTGQDFISRQLEKLFAIFGVSFAVNSLLIFIILLFIFKALFTLLVNYLQTRIVSDYQIRTRIELFQKVLGAKWPYLLQQKLGHLENILMQDVSSAANLFSQISGTLTMLASLVVYLLVAINISASITAFTLALGGALFFALRPVMARVKGVAFERSLLHKEIAHLINENTVGMKTIKTMLAEGPVVKKGRRLFSRWQTLTVKTAILKNLISSFIQPLGVIFVVLIFATTYKSAAFNIAALAAIVYLIQRIFVYIEQLQMALHSANDLMPHLQNVLNYQKVAEQNRETDMGLREFVFNDKVVFQDIDFAYPGKEETKVLEDITFEIHKGELVGLIGPSGVGKTTLVDLILRLFEPSSGRILLDGVDISEISLDSWRAHIGYVSQDIFLINDTIKNNIQFYDEALSEEDIVAAARQANIYDFIQTLPNKFDTMTGERGVLLSAGQKQRLVIARILARKPQLLILDEATSALDNESELMIQNVIRGLKNKVTVLMIAHRLSTLSDIDKLIVLENGKVREQGRPLDLLADKQSYFFRMSHLKEAIQ
ncbi:MAG: ABC transporter ATP-binding protein [bacterium]|nr:ABC transporter ATP-binding protein [bacterium]